MAEQPSSAGNESGSDAEVVEGVSRHDIFPNNGCEHECEGVGWVPIYMAEGDHRPPNGLACVSETSPLYVYLWQEAERENPTQDGWHFVKCAACDAVPPLQYDRQASS